MQDAVLSAKQVLTAEIVGCWGAVSRTTHGSMVTVSGLIGSVKTVTLPSGENVFEVNFLHPKLHAPDGTVSVWTGPTTFNVSEKVILRPADDGGYVTFDGQRLFRILPSGHSPLVFAQAA